jgi:glutamate/tyrosine decarboxylase-like PLP-dependent enzyme
MIAGMPTRRVNEEELRAMSTFDLEAERAAAHRAVDLAFDQLATVAERPVYRRVPTDVRARLTEAPLPRRGLSVDEILDEFEAAVAPYPMGDGHPRFFGWVAAPPTPVGAIADLLAAALNPSCYGGDQAATYVEDASVRWLMELVGFPTEASKGLLVSGGSMASLTGIAAARHWAARRDGWDVRAEGLQGKRPPLVLYVSSEAHTALRKAAELLGIGEANVRVVPVDAAFRLDVDALRVAIADDRAQGRRPFCVVASAGTVNTGAIDPLDATANLCAAEALWFHVDGAYGAVGLLDPAVANRYAGLERADSVAIDPHKWLSVPYECGCALVRDGGLLRDAFSLVPPYLREEEGTGSGSLPGYQEFGFQQTRGFRALKLWMSLLHLGREGYARIVARHNALARHLAALVDTASDLERAAPVELSIVCFRYVPAHLRNDEAALDALNKAIVEAVQVGGEVFLTQAVLNGRFVLRANVMHYDTHEEDVDALVAVVRRTGLALATI